MIVLVKFQIEIRFSIELHGEFKIVDDVMSTIVWVSSGGSDLSHGLPFSFWEGLLYMIIVAFGSITFFLGVIHAYRLLLLVLLT